MHETTVIESNGNVLTKTVTKDQNGNFSRMILRKDPTLTPGGQVPESTLKELDALITNQD